jgi:predicted homoserine dehydrogenase-like protein
LEGLPLGLAHHVRLHRAVAAGQPVCWTDVEIDEAAPAVRFRRTMEKTEFGVTT